MESLTQSETDKETPMCPWLKQIKPWNGLGTYVDHLANHYALMAMNPATIDQARHRCKELKKDFPGLDTLIVKRLKEINDDRKL